MGLNINQTKAFTKAERIMITLLAYKSMSNLICKTHFKDDISSIEGCIHLTEGPILLLLYFYTCWVR